jgi:hypothetical protein
VNTAVRDLLHEMAGTTPELPRAACRDHVEVFDSLDPGDIDRAIQICCGCVELEPCRQWADSLGRRALIGVVAGKLRTYTFRGKETL